MDKTIYVIGHKNPDTDSICGAICYTYFLKQKFPNKKFIAARAGKINLETKFVLKYFNIKKPILLNNAKNKNIIIIDHNEISQAIKNIKQANILEIIDHHRVGNVETIKPTPFINEPCGATSSIITEKFNLFKIPLTKKYAGLLLSAILSDTILLKSPTTTTKDRILIKKLAKIANINIKKYGKQMLKSGCDIINHSAKKILETDFKIYKKIGIGQILIIDTEIALRRKYDLLKEMNKKLKSEKFDHIFLMITNILSLETNLLIVSKNLKKVAKVFKKEIINNVIFLPNTVSRKAQIQPIVLKLF